MRAPGSRRRRRDTGPADAVVVDPAELAARLEVSRLADDVRRGDELARLRSEAAHRRSVADVRVDERLADLARTEEQAAAEAWARLARLDAEAREAGERTRVTARMARSAEMRALRLEQLRAQNLRLLVPVLLAFAAWSTTGVQAGAARLMRVGSGEPMWWVLWLLEPALIGAVVWIIVVRARLAVSGGKLSAAAEVVAAGCLLTSVGLNVLAAAPAGNALVSTWVLVGAMLAHAIGPVGAAVTAYLIGVIDRSISAADPWGQGGGETPVVERSGPGEPDAEAGAAPAVPATLERIGAEQSGTVRAGSARSGAGHMVGAVRPESARNGTGQGSGTRTAPEAGSGVSGPLVRARQTGPAGADRTGPAKPGPVKGGPAGRSGSAGRTRTVPDQAAGHRSDRAVPKGPDGDIELVVRLVELRPDGPERGTGREVRDLVGVGASRGERVLSLWKAANNAPASAWDRGDMGSLRRFLREVQAEAGNDAGEPVALTALPQRRRTAV